MNHNPYESPSIGDDEGALGDFTEFAKDTHEASDNLRFASRIVRGISICCALAAVYSLVSLVMGFYYLVFTGSWSWFHTQTMVKGLTVPAYVILCRFSWCYAKTLRHLSVSMSRSNEMKTESHIENLTWLSLGVAFLIFCKTSDFCVQLSMALFFFQMVKRIDGWPRT